MLLFYVRHGDPIYNPDSLTPLGCRQAEAIGRRLARYGLDKVFVSSSTRAIQTAQPACEMLHMQPTVLDWTNEGHAWREMTLTDENDRLEWCFNFPQVQELFTSREIQKMGGDWHQHPFFEGNTIGTGYLRIQQETHAWLRTLGFAWDAERGQYQSLHYNKEKTAYTRPEEEGQRVALFAHQGFGLAFLSSLLDIPYPYVCQKMDICHSSLSVIHFAENRPFVIPKLLTLSNDGHLLADGLPTRYNNMLFF